MGLFSEQKKKKIVVLLGHSDKETLCGHFADIYEAVAKKSGHEVQRFNVGDMQFDPILHKGYKTIQNLEPDLRELQEAIAWSEHFVVIYPTWWCTMPALLKGLFDRMWLPGFAFNMRKHKDGTLALGWKKRLKGKTARAVVVSGNAPFLIWLVFGDYTNEIKRGILWFAGFTTRVSRIGPADHAVAWKIREWERHIERLAKLGE